MVEGTEVGGTVVGATVVDSSVTSVDSFVEAVVNSDDFEAESCVALF